MDEFNELALRVSDLLDERLNKNNVRQLAFLLRFTCILAQHLGISRVALLRHVAEAYDELPTYSAESLQ